MNLFNGLSQGFVLGLILSPACFGVCFPLLFPYFSSEEQPWSRRIFDLGWFLSGRFAGYLAVGALAGWLGKTVLDTLMSAQWLEGFGYLALGLVLAVYGLIKSFPHWAFCQWGTSLFWVKRAPFWLGVFTGLNICPPFVAAFFEAARAGGIIGGLAVFSGFFAGTSAILLPIPLIGGLASQKSLRYAGRIAAIVVGVWFMLQGLKVLVF